MNRLFSTSYQHPDNGELYTWGKAGPHLGYELDDGVTKQLRPKRVELSSESSDQVTIVSCGLGHTLGMSWSTVVCILKC